eukprot:gene22596-27275_t
MGAKCPVPAEPSTPIEAKKFKGRRVLKEFPPEGKFSGRVVKYLPPGSVIDGDTGEPSEYQSWSIVYDDGDKEDVTWDGLSTILTDPSPKTVKESASNRDRTEVGRHKIERPVASKRKTADGPASPALINTKSPKKHAKQPKLGLSPAGKSSPSAELGTVIDLHPDDVMTDASNDVLPNSVGASISLAAAEKGAVPCHARGDTDFQAKSDKPMRDAPAQLQSDAAPLALAQEKGVTITVWVPTPIEYATRHQSSCSCALCKHIPAGQKKMAAISKGKGKGWYNQAAPHLPGAAVGSGGVGGSVAKAIETLQPTERSRFVERQAELEAEFAILEAKAKAAEAKSQTEQTRGKWAFEGEADRAPQT